MVLTPEEQYEYLRREVRYHLTAPGDYRRGKTRARAAIADYARTRGKDPEWCANLLVELLAEVEEAVAPA